MYKYIFAITIIAIFTACSAPKPETKPSWYITLPKDLNYFYATAEDIDKQLARKKAIFSLRKQIENELNNNFKNNKTNLSVDKNENIDDILNENKDLANTLIMKTSYIDKSAKYKNKTLVLIKISRKDIFDLIDKKSKKILYNSKKQLNSISKEVPIKRFIKISELMKIYPKLASHIEAKKLSLFSYDTTKEFDFLNQLKDSYSKLKKDISFYVLSDLNSRVFAPTIKKALKEKGLNVSSKPASKDSIKLFITSNTDNTQDYSFKQSKSLVKFSCYDLNKKELSFKQHTFIGKSRKNHQDAKEQSAISVQNKIKKIGIFGFLGLN